MSGSVNKNTKTHLALISLMISTFAIGTTEFIIMGILPDAALLTVLCIGVVLIGWIFDRKEEKRAQVNQDLIIRNA
ncbi:hypothetical protein ACFDTO_22810 [Microbacteriaceae bacterium 4G12]